jgi:hypothetical protein
MVERPAVSAQGGTRVKKVILIVAVAALALTIAPLAASAQGKAHKRGHLKFNLVGVVSQDFVPFTVEQDGTITPASDIMIHVKAGTKTVRAFRGDDVTMGFAPNARILWIGHGKAKRIGLEQISPGAKVKARGIIDRRDAENPVFTIKNLKVRQKAMPELPMAPTEVTIPAQ